MTAAAKTSGSVEPPTVQGGVIGAADVASSTTAAPSATAKSAAESIWTMMARPWVLFLIFLGWLLLF
jgi:UDP-N-acetyl-D-mannosaminuronic acid transferase (WecB/TagA/CpsF family)